ncbi:TetR/AcrR family transcriptional regulator [Marinicrinis lubricantis]|uniref:TetR/AcrR family transcriptional regulator n=1 Tax=Marinicrinis lubricantis TaxID=2086470 RepID=A0ABW1ILB1_9BACL
MRNTGEKDRLILSGALRVFSEKGFHKARISDIAKAAGVADGTIYLYFKNKEDILVSLFRARLGELVGKFKESLKPDASAVEALKIICDLHFKEMESDPAFAVVTQIELRQSSMQLRKEIGIALKPYILLIEGILQKGIHQGHFHPHINIKLLRSLLFGALDEAVTSWLIGGQKYPLTALSEPTLRFFLNGLTASKEDAYEHCRAAQANV